VRAFIAVDVSSVDRISRAQQEIASTARWSGRDVKPVETGNFHFTLIFLGEISDSQVDSIKQALSGVRFERFKIAYSSMGAFPRPEAAKVIWLGVDSVGAQELTSLASTVVAAVSGSGFRPDKPFSPHLTIFRVKARYPVDVAGIVRKYESSTFGTDVIEKVHLKKSELTPAGPVYSNVYTVEAWR